jgi:hypothetical protein
MLSQKRSTKELRTKLQLRSSGKQYPQTSGPQGYIEEKHGNSANCPVPATKESNEFDDSADESAEEDEKEGEKGSEEEDEQQPTDISAGEE